MAKALDLGVRKNTTKRVLLSRMKMSNDWSAYEKPWLW